MPRYSNSTDFNLTTQQIIKSALRKIKVIGEDETPNASVMNDAREQLNLMLNGWRTEKICLWLNREFTLFLKNAGQLYRLGANGENATEFFYETTLSGDEDEDQSTLSITSNQADTDGICRSQAVAGADNLIINGEAASGGIAYSPIARKVCVLSSAGETDVVFTITGTDAYGETKSHTVTVSGVADLPYSITSELKTVTSVAAGGACAGNITVGFWGMQVSDYIGVELDDNTMYWDIIKTAAPQTQQVTVYGSLPSDATSGNKVYVYKTKLPRPLSIENARFVISDSNQRPLNRLDSVDDYKRIVNKSSTGEANSFVYDPLVDNGLFYVWPTAGRVDRTIQGEASIPIFDADNNVQNIEVPREYLNAIVFNLALELSTEYQGAVVDAITIGRAQELKKYLRENNTGSNGFRFVPRKR